MSSPVLVEGFTPQALAVRHPLALASMCRVDGPGGPEPWVLWPHQAEIMSAVLEHRRTVVLKARQLGVTWAMAGLALWSSLAYPARRVLALSIGERQASVLLQRVGRLYDSLPAEVRRAFPTSQRSATVFGVKHPDGPSLVISLPSSGGRSETAHMLMLDEGAHWQDSDEQLAAVLPTAADAGRVLMASTARGMEGRFYELYSGAPDNGWHPIFVDAGARPGRDDAWISEQRAALGDLGPQEFPRSAEEAFLSSGRGAFDPLALAWLRVNSCRPAPWIGVLEEDGGEVVARRRARGQWKVWEPPRPGRAYLMAADACAGPGAQDYAAVAVFDRGSHDQVAACHGRLAPDELATELWRAGHLYRDPEGRPALCAPEVNNHGAGVVALLLDWGYPSMWRQERFDQRVRRPTEQVGWMTSGKSRAYAISMLGAAIKEGSWGVRDLEAVAEMAAFVSNGNRFEAAAGKHDDRVLTHAIAAAVLAHSPRAVAPRTGVSGQAGTVYVPRSSITGY